MSGTAVFPAAATMHQTIGCANLPNFMAALAPKSMASERLIGPCDPLRTITWRRPRPMSYLNSQNERIKRDYLRYQRNASESAWNKDPVFGVIGI
jgi:hypothetical protein